MSIHSAPTMYSPYPRTRKTTETEERSELRVGEVLGEAEGKASSGTVGDGLGDGMTLFNLSSGGTLSFL